MGADSAPVWAGTRPAPTTPRGGHADARAPAAAVGVPLVGTHRNVGAPLVGALMSALPTGEGRHEACPYETPQIKCPMN